MSLISPEAITTLRDAVLLDSRPSDEAYARGHVEGARHAHLERDLSGASEPDFDPARGGRHPLPSIDKWRRTVERWGIRPDTKVIVYDDQSGANAAARAWWMLRAIGHRDVSVVDGGFQALVAAGVPMTRDVPGIAPAPPYPATSWLNPTVDREEVDALRSKPSWRVLDVRAPERFRGEIEPIDPIAGHIEGAVNLFFGENLIDGRFKPAAALRQQYEDLLGDIPAERLIVHCGSGVTACHTLLALDLAGITGAALYVGSWGEWCRNGVRATN